MKLKKIFIAAIIGVLIIFLIIGKEKIAHRDVRNQFDFWAKLIKSNDKFVQMGAVRALGSLGDKRAVKLIIPLLRDENLWVNVETIWSLGRLGDREAVEPLVDLLQTSVNPPVRREAAISLGLLGDNRAVIPLIMRLKNDNNALVRAKIIEALGMLGDKQAITSVKYYRRDKDIWVRTEAEKALRKLSN